MRWWNVYAEASYSTSSSIVWNSSASVGKTWFLPVVSSSSKNSVFIPFFNLWAPVNAMVMQGVSCYGNKQLASFPSAWEWPGNEANKELPIVCQRVTCSSQLETSIRECYNLIKKFSSWWHHNDITVPGGHMTVRELSLGECCAA